MEEVRLLLREDGREARNVFAFHVSVDDSRHYGPSGKLYRKPPCAPRTPEPRRPLKRVSTTQQPRVGSHVRSASTGRDKRSDLRARYWALLFGNLQRAVGEIYNTVETHESLAECQEVVLVMENYTRDFRSLAEWFRLKWEYENTPAPQRPTSLAWEIRKASLPSPSHSERVSPSPSFKQGRVSPQNKGIERLILKDTATSVTDSTLLPVSPQPEPIIEVDEKGKELSVTNSVEVDNEKENVKPCKENVLSPSEDQKTYINVIKKSDVVSVEVSTDTDGLESAKCILHKKVGVVKVSQASQTDEDSSAEKGTDTNMSLNKTVKVDVRSNRLVHNSSSLKPAYSTAVSRNTKPHIKSSQVLTPRPNDNSSNKPATTIRSTSSVKTIITNRNMKPLESAKPSVKLNNNRLLRSKTSGDIKPSALNYNISLKNNSFMKQKSTVGIHNNVLSSKSGVSQKTNSIQSLTIRKTVSSHNLHKNNEKNVRPTSKFNVILPCKLKPSKDSDIDSISSSAETIVNTCGNSNNGNDIKEFKNNTSAEVTNGIVTDGWLTVKCRSRFKSNNKLSERRSLSHWTNRFNEVSGTASLPALALFHESDTEMSDEKNKKSECTKKVTTAVTPELYLKRTNTILSKCLVKSSKNKVPTHNLESKNSKSMETKTTKTFNQISQNQNFKEVSNQNERIEGSKTAEVMITKILDKTPSQKEDIANNMNFNLTLEKSDEMSRKLCNENEPVLKGNLPKLEINEDLDDIDHSDKGESQDEEEHTRKTRQLSEEEAMLTQEIAELQSSAVDVDTETDGTETDGEIGDDEEDVILRTEDDELSLEARYEPVLAGMSWGERMDTLAALEDLVARHPGRAIRLHQKLSNPARTRSLPEILRRYQVKHSRAQQRRHAIQQERTVRLQALLARVEDVKTAKLQLIEEKRIRMENRLQRAEQNRTEHLKSVVRKAHDEEEKLREIAFIKELEAQNKRHDFLELCREQKDRLLDLREGQRKRIEEQAARGAAVEERRRALELERQSRLERLQAERKLRAERVGRRQRERQEQAREKARGREERLSALHAQQLASTQELQKRISQKQKESARRHEENIEQIRQKALELSILRSHIEEPNTPALTPYEAQKLCTVCNVHITSEVYLLSHLRGRAHQEAVKLATGPLVGDQLEKYELAHIVDAPANEEHPRVIAARERTKLLRKRCKKIRQRMVTKGSQFDSEHKSPTPDATSKRMFGRGVQKVSSLMAQGWSTNVCSQLDRVLGELNRQLLKNLSQDLVAFQAVGWFGVLAKLLGFGLEPSTSPPIKSMISACNLWQLACKQGTTGADNCRISILSNHIIVILDLLNLRLQGLAKDDRLPAEPLATAAMQVLATILENVPDTTPAARIQDVVSYSVCVGIVEQLAQCCISVREPVHNNIPACNFLQAALGLLTGMARRCGPPPVESISVSSTCSNELIKAIYKKKEHFNKTLESEITLNSDKSKLLSKKKSESSPTNSAKSPAKKSNVSKQPSLENIELEKSVSELTESNIESECKENKPDEANNIVDTDLNDKSTPNTSSSQEISLDSISNRTSASSSTSSRTSSVSTAAISCDPAHFTSALHATELVGVVSMMYGILLPTGASPRCEGKAPTEMPTLCLALATAACRLLRYVAELDLKRFQEALGAEGVSLQFRHIAGHLLWYCASPPKTSNAEAARTLLHEVINVIGYFAVGHTDNQMLLVSGYAPSVLQQLCTLPFQYFSEAAFSNVLYPTLLACCCGNQHTTHILQQELSYQLLEEYRCSEAGRDHQLVRLLPIDS